MINREHFIEHTKIKKLSEQHLNDFNVYKEEIENIENWDQINKTIRWINNDKTTSYGLIQDNVNQVGSIIVDNYGIIYGNCFVKNRINVSNFSRISGNCKVKEMVDLYSRSQIYGKSVVRNNVILSNSTICDNAYVCNGVFLINSTISENASVSGPLILENVNIKGDVKINQNILKNLGCKLDDDYSNYPKKPENIPGYRYNMNKTYILKNYDIYDEKTLRYAAFINTISGNL